MIVNYKGMYGFNTSYKVGDIVYLYNYGCRVSFYLARVIDEGELQYKSDIFNIAYAQVFIPLNSGNYSMSRSNSSIVSGMNCITKSNSMYRAGFVYRTLAVDITRRSGSSSAKIESGKEISITHNYFSSDGSNGDYRTPINLIDSVYYDTENLDNTYRVSIQPGGVEGCDLINITPNQDSESCSLFIAYSYPAIDITR